MSDYFDTSMIILPGIAVSSMDKLPLGFDVSLNVEEGETISTLVAELYIESSEVEFDDGILDGPQNTTANIIQVVVGDLVRGVVYRLQVSYQTNTNKVLSFAQPMKVVF